jgi:hypothetical protein
MVGEETYVPEVFFVEPTDPWKEVSFKSSGRILCNNYKDPKDQKKHTSYERKLSGAS